MGKGIIAGFIGGAGKGMAQVGNMVLQEKLRSEQAEADDMRTRELNKNKQDFTREENRLDRESREGVADKKLKASAKDGRTNVEKNAAYYKDQGYPDDVANAAAGSNFKEVKDKETGETALINTLTSKEVGRMKTTKNGQEWVPAGGQTKDATVTKLHRNQAAEWADNQAGWTSTDKTDFEKWGGDRKLAIREKAQELANSERGDTKAETGEGGKGIIDSSKDKPPVKTKKHTGQQFTAADYKSKLKSHYGDKITDEKIEEMLTAAKSAGKIK